MKKQLGIIVCMSLLFIVWFSGCNSSTQTYEPEPISDELFIGAWSTMQSGYEFNFTFYSNHSYSIDVHDNITWMNYEIVEGKFQSIDFSGQPINADFLFTENNNKLTLTDEDGEMLVLTRK